MSPSLEAAREAIFEWVRWEPRLESTVPGQVQGLHEAPMNPPDTWARLSEEVSECTRCALCQTRQQAVLGVGDRQARLMIIGEAPGAEEDARGEPFVGQAGKLLDNMLFAIGLERHTGVYIANVLKCRPPGNRNPEPSEVAQCEPFLMRQLHLLQPSALLLMGRFAAQSILKTDATISALRQQVHQVAFEGRQIPAIVSYHPAYLLRNQPDKSKAWADLLRLQSVLNSESVPDAARVD